METAKLLEQKATGQNVLFRAWGRLLCLFGRHLPGVYYGKIHIEHINYQTHAITYGNWRHCPRCGKKLGVDYS